MPNQAMAKKKNGVRGARGALREQRNNNVMVLVTMTKSNEEMKG